MKVCLLCGRIFISKDLAERRMAEVEEQLEDKYTTVSRFQFRV